MVNILFVGGGRRISLAKRFIECDCRVFSYELDENAPIAKVATIISGLKWSEENISHDIMNKAIDNKIDLVIPLQDEALSIVSHLNVTSPTSAGYINDICTNKSMLQSFCLENKNLESIYPKPDYFTPIIVKPVRGFGSRGIMKFGSMEDYEEKCEISDDYIVQKLISGTEYSVDCYFNKDNNLVGAVPRERITVCGGEVTKTKTLSRNDKVCQNIINITELIGKHLRPCGPMCIFNRDKCEVWGRVYSIVRCRF